MQKIKNKKCIYRLSYRILTAKKRKNLVAITAIILTTIMFTALFTVTSNMIENFQKTTMRQVGSSSMVELKDILPKEYKLFAKDKEVKNPSYRIFIGNAVNEELAKVTTEVYYTTKENAEKMFCLPTVGTMPENKMEIAVSTRVLDAMKLPYQLGETIKLQISVNETIIENEFTLCGYWQGDNIAMAQMCFLSREYCDEIVPTVDVSVKENEYQYSGYWNMSFDFSNSFNIEKKTKELIKRNGYQLKDIEYGINWGYTFHSIDKEMIICFLGIASLILISGYLIIYNIFSLNIVMEIQNYGLYKTIGMTEKQLKRLVRQEAILLSLAGIPIGCILGVIFGKIIFPFVIKNFQTGGIVENSFHPFFLLFAAVFSFFTVWISCDRPCKLAAKVSPIEAVKYIEVSKIKGKKKKAKKAWNKMTICSLGWANLGRNKKKVALVICSLSLSLVLLSSVYTIVHGFQLEKYVSDLLIGDAMVTDVSILNLASYEKNLEGITPKIKKELADLPGVKEIHTISCNDSSGIFMDDAGMEKLDTLLEKYEKYVEDQKEFFQYVKEDKELFCQMYGIDSWGTEQLSYYDGAMDWKKFQTGDYVLVSPWTANLVDNTTQESYYKPGEKVSLCFPDGTKKEYEIMAIAEMPYALSSRFMSTLGASIILPETEYEKHIVTENHLWSVLFMEKGKEEIGYQSVRDYTEHIETGLDTVLKQTYEKEFNEYVMMYFVTGGCLSLVMAVIGILNFINAMIMGILTRKQEFAMMEAVGMTGGQLKKMLVWEGSFYAFFTIIISIVAGLVIQVTIVKHMMAATWFFEFHFTIMPIIICIPILLLFACLIPLIIYKKVTKESVVERLRNFL